MFTTRVKCFGGATAGRLRTAGKWQKGSGHDNLRQSSKGQTSAQKQKRWVGRHGPENPVAVDHEVFYYGKQEARYYRSSCTNTAHRNRRFMPGARCRQREGPRQVPVSCCSASLLLQMLPLLLPRSPLSHERSTKKTHTHRHIYAHTQPSLREASGHEIHHRNRKEEGGQIHRRTAHSKALETPRQQAAQQIGREFL